MLAGVDPFQLMGIGQMAEIAHDVTIPGRSDSIPF
jgi:hypothetical protein